MKEAYTQIEFDEFLSNVEARHGWDFSRMKTMRQAVPWDYLEEVKERLQPSYDVLDVGTGGGERFSELARYFRTGLGVDIDPGMIAVAQENARSDSNLTFLAMDEKLADLGRDFDVIINRHAPFALTAIKNHLRPGGYFITQQVGEKNMQNVREALRQSIGKPVISQEMLTDSGLDCVEFREYNVEYVVQDIESLVFWLNALDMLHADLPGSDALRNVDTLNHILADNVDSRGFVTNEHRYLATATL
jgi:SAM-dependent methyltransferase